MPAAPRTSAAEQLLEHRVAALESTAAIARQVERDVDHLKLLGTHTQEMLAEFKAEVRERDQHTSSSLTRLHERLDESLKALVGEVTRLAGVDAREQGAREERERGNKRFWVAVGALAATFSAVVAVLALVLH